MIDVLHGLAMASWTPNRGHTACRVTAEFGRADGHINDGFMDQHLFTADRAALETFLRRRAKRFVQGVRRDRRVALATPISPL